MIICRIHNLQYLWYVQNMFADFGSKDKLILVLKEKGKGLENDHSPESHNGSKSP